MNEKQSPIREPLVAVGRSVFFELSEDLFCVVGSDGYLRDVNPAWERALGFSREELLSHPVLEFVLRFDADKVKEALRAALAGEPQPGFQCRMVTKEGSYRWIRWSPDFVVADGAIHAVARDTTESRNEQEARFETEAGFGLLAEAVQHHLVTIRDQAELLEAAHDAILVRDLEGRVLYWNRGAEELYGWSRAEAVGQVTTSLLGTQFPKAFAAIRSELLESGRWEGELVHRRRDGRPVVVSSRWVIRHDPRVEGTAILEINTDVTEQRLAQEALRQSEARFRAVFESAAIGIALADLDGLLVAVNPAMETLLGYERQELLGRALTEFAHPDEARGDHLAFGELIDGSRPSYRVERRFIRRDGSVLPARVTVSFVRDAEGQPGFVLRMVEDMSLALIDELTGLNNRRAFLAFAAQQLKVARRERRKAALLFIDVDGLKSINDTFGHVQGDQALRDVGLVLARRLRAADFAARIGGDEFCVLLFEGEHPDDAVARLHAELVVWREQAGRPYELSVSIGLARFDWRAPSTVEELLAEADRAMYRARAR